MMSSHKIFKLQRVIIILAALVISVSAIAQVTATQEPLVFMNQQQQERFDKLTQELRCLVCQNQNLADSDAPLAHDLRREVHQMLLSGRTNEQIKLFLVSVTVILCCTGHRYRKTRTFCGWDRWYCYWPVRWFYVPISLNVLHYWMQTKTLKTDRH